MLFPAVASSSGEWWVNKRCSCCRKHRVWGSRRRPDKAALGLACEVHSARRHVAFTLHRSCHNSRVCRRHRFLVRSQIQDNYQYAHGCISSEGLPIPTPLHPPKPSKRHRFRRLSSPMRRSNAEVTFPVPPARLGIPNQRCAPSPHH